MSGVPCPQCKGGCSLCGGSGTVNDSVAKLYIREESRATAKMPARQIESLWAKEAPTRPDAVKRAEKRVRRVTYAVIGFAVLLFALLIVVLTRL